MSKTIYGSYEKNFVQWYMSTVPNRSTTSGCIHLPQRRSVESQNSVSYRCVEILDFFYL